MNIAIAADANLKMGTGHLMRSMALAHKLKQRGWNVIFITCCQSRTLLERLRKLTKKVYSIKESKLKSFEEIIKKEKADWVILDGYQYDVDYQKRIKALGGRIVIIDDFAHLDHYYADIVLNQNYGAENFSYNSETYTRFLIGTRYVLLREEFLRYRNYIKLISGTARKILVTMGGADADNRTLDALKAIDIIDDTLLEVKIVIGANNKNYSLIKKEAAISRHIVEVLKDVTRMSPLMKWADIAISAGGTTTWEILFMGLPGILCALADNQEPAVNELAKEGFFVANWIKSSDIINLSKMLNHLIHDKTLRKELSEKGKKMIDGNGADRLIRKMTETPMRILFLGGNMAEDLYKWLLNEGEEVIYTEDRVNEDIVKEAGPDLIVSYNYKFILKRDVLRIPRRGAINLHISYLPWNRGANPNIWSFIDDTPKGVTIHYIDEGIDTGDILLQKKINIEEDEETLHSSYEKLHRGIQELFSTNWKDLREGKIKPKSQPRKGTLHYSRDRKLYEHLIKEKGWDTPVSELKQRS